MKKSLITQEGYNKLKEELDNLILNKRKEMAKLIKEAREQGDISENADYDAAREKQGQIESRIIEIKDILANSEIHNDENYEEGTIHIGSTVKVYDIEFDDEATYTIVGSSETNSLHNKISNESPLGSSLIGKKVNDTIEVHIQNGKITYKILEVNN